MILTKKLKNIRMIKVLITIHFIQLRLFRIHKNLLFMVEFIVLMKLTKKTEWEEISTFQNHG